MKKLTALQAASVLNWFRTEGQSNWGTWTHHGLDLPCGASILQYDTNQAQINLDENVALPDGTVVTGFTASRFPVGRRWQRNLTFSSLESLFFPEAAKKRFDDMLAESAAEQMRALEALKSLGIEVNPKAGKSEMRSQMGRIYLALKERGMPTHTTSSMKWAIRMLA